MLTLKFPLILASSSPRRREILSNAGLAFEVQVSNCDESLLPAERAQPMVERLARAKAQAVARQFPDRWVLGADTTVVADDEILGKPENADDARRMLQILQGRTHIVWGGIALVCEDRGYVRVASFSTEVSMRAMSAADIDAYIATGEPLDKAGAYAIQGIGAALIRSISGSYFNVVGLDIAAVVDMLRDAEIM